MVSEIYVRLREAFNSGFELEIILGLRNLNLNWISGMARVSALFPASMENYDWQTGGSTFSGVSGEILWCLNSATEWRGGNWRAIFLA